ncbi:hypothetical protein E6O75_ATG06346 [Venturia nashicola]|uniref:Uncharacterized protein n=1 Tax=Venturia nashicola TaxID=86259 RepID=A0A4Z1P2E4_9PEZI|nr:hypothetical protein E6O75_ATG06346 [Venturia nashicola]
MLVVPFNPRRPIQCSSSHSILLPHSILVLPPFETRPRTANITNNPSSISWLICSRPPHAVGTSQRSNTGTTVVGPSIPGANSAGPECWDSPRKGSSAVGNVQFEGLGGWRGDSEDEGKRSTLLPHPKPGFFSSIHSRGHSLALAIRSPSTRHPLAILSRHPLSRPSATINHVLTLSS